MLVQAFSGNLSDYSTVDLNQGLSVCKIQAPEVKDLPDWASLELSPSGESCDLVWGPPRCVWASGTVSPFRAEQGTSLERTIRSWTHA